MKITLLLKKECILLNLLFIVLMLPKCCSDKANYVLTGSAQNNNNDNANDVNQNSKINQEYSFDPNFNAPKYGPVTAVFLDKQNNLNVMYRRDRLWDASTFDKQNIYNDISLGPIKEDIIFTLNRQTGEILKSWGKNLFYLPHGLTVDSQNNAYVTDVAMHQVFKFALNESSERPILTLGEAFKPGQRNRFCKPTSVAVLDALDMSFFVADGYCNSRIVQYSKDGIYLRHWGESSISGESVHPSLEGTFFIPHALTLVEEPGMPLLLCVADRENGRIQCFDALKQTFVTQYHNPTVGTRIFSVAYAKGSFYVINGPDFSDHEVAGYVIDLKTARVTSKFNINGSTEQGLSNPHDISVTNDASEIFVAELDPGRLVKFVYTNGTNKIIRKNVVNSDDTDGALNFGISINSQPTLILVVAMMISFSVMGCGIILFNLKRRRGKISLKNDIPSRHIEYSHLMSNNMDEI